MQSKSASMSSKAVMQYGETSLDLFLHKRFKSFWLPGIIITYHILEIQKTQGFLFILKHSDTFYFSNLCFVLYNKSVCYCISLVTVEKKAISRTFQILGVLYAKKWPVLNTPTTNLLAQLISAKFNGNLQFCTIWECVCGKCVHLSAMKGSAQPSVVLILPILPLSTTSQHSYSLFTYMQVKSKLESLGFKPWRF